MPCCHQWTTRQPVPVSYTHLFSSGWLQDEITLRDLPITLLGGTRYDSYRGSSDGYKDVDADKWSSRAGMTINPANWLMLFGSYAQAFRAPTMGEMYNDSKHFSIGRFYTCLLYTSRCV